MYAHFRELADVVKRGVSEAGGFPVEFPVMSLGETLIKPTAILYRNLASMDVKVHIEHLLQKQPRCAKGPIACRLV